METTIMGYIGVVENETEITILYTKLILGIGLAPVTEFF